MSSVNRVLQKRRKAHNTTNPVTHDTSTTESDNIHISVNPNQAQQKVAFDPERQKKFQEYANYAYYNSPTFEFSNSYAPCSLGLYNKYRVPMSCFFTPISQEIEYTERSANAIPRCSCRAYMNYYNESTKKGFRCFLCGRENQYDCDYDHTAEYVERQSPNFLVDGPTGIYNDIPPEQVFIFIVDVSRQAWQCKMLGYLVAVLKEVFAREEMNETQIYFYTYDEVIHEYDFSGQEVERTILDPTIKNAGARTQDCYLGQIRDKLLALLESLEDAAQKNPRQGSNFYSVFEHVYESTRHTGGKMFIFQANEAIIGQNFLNQNYKIPNSNTNQVKPKSFLQTKNKTFFNGFVQRMLTDNISMSLFVFGRAFKNIRVFSDTCKLTNSEMLYYSKDSPEDLNKFYYELYQLVGAHYYTDVRIEFMISSGWYYTAVYGNLYRLKQFITFKMCHLERSKKVCAVFLPQEGFNPLPYFSIQLVVNYLSNRKHYMQVTTAVLPFTSNIDLMFQSINHQISTATVFRTYLSSLRLEEIASVKNKYVKNVALIWRAVHDYYKGNISSQFRNMLLAFLAFLKNYHYQIDQINDTLILDKVIAQRNLLQACNYQQPVALLTPYLFDLTTIGNDRCLQDNFIYPDVCELRFSSVKEGLFLMDCGVALYLFIAKTCHPDFLTALFGKQKFNKNEVLTQEMIAEQGTTFSQKVLNLVKVLRESKSYGWVPLYIVRCHETSINEKNFYLNFYEEKYDEYRSSKIGYEQFINMLSKQQL